MIKHRTYRAAAHDRFPYADFDGGDGRYTVIRKCARFYRRGYTRDYWRRWHLSLFLTEEFAEENSKIPCEDYLDSEGMRHVLCSRGDHFLFVLPRLIKDIPKSASMFVSKAEPEKQGSLF
jgi:hypothetical protein